MFVMSWLQFDFENDKLIGFQLRALDVKEYVQKLYPHQRRKLLEHLPMWSGEEDHHHLSETETQAGKCQGSTRC